MIIMRPAPGTENHQPRTAQSKTQRGPVCEHKGASSGNGSLGRRKKRHGDCSVTSAQGQISKEETGQLVFPQ